MPKVSVIIPTYNRAQMVCQAIDSVLDQAFDNCEIVVVDDGSTDETEEILHRRYGDRITYLYQDNQGRASARNRGVRVSSGEYLQFLDSDDWLLPHALEIQANFLDRHPEVDVIYGDGYYCNQNGEPIQRISEERPPTPEEGLLAIMILHNIVVATHSAMVRRRALEELDHSGFDEHLRGTEDADFWLRLAANGAEFAAHDEPVCQYRLHGSNATLRSHPQWERRWRSVQRFKRKVLEANFFSGLPLWTRREFLRQLLLTFFDGERDAQEEIVGSNHFQALPILDQTALLYYLGVETIVRHRDLVHGREWLRRAAQLAPLSRSRLALALSYPRGIPLSWMISLRRRRMPSRSKRALAPHWREAGAASPQGA